MSDGVRFEASLERSRQRVAERDATLVAAGAHQEKTAGRDGGTEGRFDGAGLLATLGLTVTVIGALASVRGTHVGSVESRRTTTLATGRTRRNSVR